MAFSANCVNRGNTAKHCLYAALTQSLAECYSPVFSLSSTSCFSSGVSDRFTRSSSRALSSEWADIVCGISVSLPDGIPVPITGAFPGKTPQPASHSPAADSLGSCTMFFGDFRAEHKVDYVPNLARKPRVLAPFRHSSKTNPDRNR
jgi:hypothetical protein